jgi:hypothetical protein
LTAKRQSGCTEEQRQKTTAMESKHLPNPAADPLLLPGKRKRIHAQISSLLADDRPSPHCSGSGKDNKQLNNRKTC